MKRKKLIILPGWGEKDYQESFNLLLSYFNPEIFSEVVYLPGFYHLLPPENVWGVSQYAQYLKHFKEKKSIDKFYLLGHSFGGQVALQYALLYPDDLEGLILYNSACIRKKSIIKKIFLLISKLIKKICPFEKPKSYLRTFFYSKIVRSSDYLKAKGVMKEIFKTVINQDLTPYLSKVKVPTLIIWGKDDKITPLWQGKLIHRLIKNSRLVVLKGGHSLHKDLPKEFATEIKKFILND